MQYSVLTVHAQVTQHYNNVLVKQYICASYYNNITVTLNGFNELGRVSTCASQRET